jgi:hypothetical protein
VEFAQGQDGICEKRFNGTGRLAARRTGVVGRRALGSELGARTVVEKSCSALYQKTAPISARARAFAVKKDSGTVLELCKKPTASGGRPTSIRVVGEG